MVVAPLSWPALLLGRQRLTVRRSPAGVVRLADVATVEDATAPRWNRVIADGRDAVVEVPAGPGGEGRPNELVAVAEALVAQYPEVARFHVSIVSFLMGGAALVSLCEYNGIRAGRWVMRFQVTVDRDEDGYWVVECPSIPGCVSQAKTREEALENIREAIVLCLEVRAERGVPLTVETRLVEVHV